MKKSILKTFLALLLCMAVSTGAQALTLAELFGMEDGDTQTQAETTPAPDGDPFEQAQVAIEAPVLLTDENIVPETLLPDPELLEISGFEAQPVLTEEINVADSEIEDDGIIRVQLRSLREPEMLTLTTDGVYTVEHNAGFRFARGTRMTLANVEDRIYMSVGGLTLDMGGSLTLTRQAADGANGLYIEESERDALYPGDLCVTAASGGLICVLHIPMEEYLQGVIAYEMSDAWPIEALKSQAVAARTYALQHKRSAGERDYDVTDTTSDQVFKGVDAEYVNVAAAVRATDGVIGVAPDGTIATCWYTASNGGMIALPTDVWIGSDECDYIERRDDPYDLENTLSIVKSLSFSSDANESEELRVMLQTALEEKYTDYDAIEFEEILSVEPVEDNPEGSRMYTKLRFTLNATAMLPAETPAPSTSPVPDATPETTESPEPTETPAPVRRHADELFVVDLPVYGSVKNGLGLGINSSDCELCTVSEADDMFTIEMRRYGHGVGMSQRGAQRMAGAHEMTWLEILNFYYPGMTLERVRWNTPELEGIEDLPDSVAAERPEPMPTPTPAPLPALESGEYYARISLGDDGSMMNLRQAPTTQSQVITQLADGQRLIVKADTADENGWVAVHTAEYSGFAKLDYLKREE